MIFGIRPVAEAIEAGREIERVYIRKGGEGQLLGELRELLARHRINTREVPVERLNRLTRGNHQGVVATISPIGYLSLDEMLERIPADETPLLVILDGITDVRNFGAIARSAECAGAHGIITPIKNGAPVNADAIRTSAGALSRIGVCRTGSIRNAINTLRAAGIRIAGATEKSEKTLFEADMTCPVAIVMGSEEDGISKGVLKLCDERLAIPLAGKVESLNVSAAAAVMLFEAVRQRQGLQVHK